MIRLMPNAARSGTSAGTALLAAFSLDFLAWSETAAAEARRLEAAVLEARAKRLIARSRG